METLIFSLLVSGSLLLAVRFGNMTDKKKIEVILERLGILIKDKDTVRKCVFVRKNKLDDGMEYVYRMPLGIAFTKIQENIQSFENGLHKNIEVEFKSGMVHFSVYEKGLERKWDFENTNREDV